MNKNDARILSSETPEELRKISIRLRERLISNRETADIIGIHEVTSSRWWKEYRQEGEDSFRYKRRGRKYGTNRTLTGRQETDIQNLIKEFTPDELNIPSALRSRKAVRELIQWRCTADMPVRTVGEYLFRWGFTPQKPLKRAYEQNPEKVEKWLSEEYPQIVDKARKEKGEIHWGDETGIRSDAQNCRGYAPCGRTPVLKHKGRRFTINTVSAVTDQGKVRFMLYEDSMNSSVLIKFMKRLSQDAERKVFLILDNLKVHHSPPVKERLKVHKNQTEVFHLPSYSPERNPDEYLNCDLKTGIHSKPAPRNKNELKKNVLPHMRMLQRSPERIKKYFQHSMILYAG